MINQDSQIGTMPLYRDLCPHLGAVGERFIIKQLSKLHLRDCVMILSKVSQHSFKYCNNSHYGEKGADLYRARCLELLDAKTIANLELSEKSSGKKFDVIFPELSILHLYKLCLKHCDTKDYYKGKDWPPETLCSLGTCLLVTNCVFADEQQQGVTDKNQLEQLTVNFTKQIIASGNIDVFQKFYQTFFLFQHTKRISKKLDLEIIFRDLYGIGMEEYLAFSFVVLSQFVIKNTDEEDWGHPHLDETSLSNLKPEFTQNLLEDLIINDSNYKKIDDKFFNVYDLIRRPLIRLEDGKIIVPNLKALFIRLTDSLYFDILDKFSDAKDKSYFSTCYGEAVEEYFKEIIENIDSDYEKPFTYGKVQTASPDAIMRIGDDGLFFECKKMQFHTLEFLRNGDTAVYRTRIKDFFHKPLGQLCRRIADFRKGLFEVSNLKAKAKIYPIIISPSAPPIFSGAWDKLNINEDILPEDYSSDCDIALPEFMDLKELECIEEYLRLNPKINFKDLIQMKRADKVNHNSNWIFILSKNGMALNNQRLVEKYFKETSHFAELVFTEEHRGNQ